MKTLAEEASERQRMRYVRAAVDHKQHTHYCMDPACPDRLTATDRSILTSLANGLSVAQAAKIAGVEHTNARHRLYVIYGQLGAVSMANAVANAIKYGYVRLDDIGPPR